MKDIMKRLGLDNVFCIDVETYYDDDYSLRKMATTEYICDPRFELQTVAVRELRWKKPRVFTAKEFIAWARTINWKRAGILAHHAQFDGLILSRHCNVIPAFYFDTLSMARPVMPVHVGGSLKALTEAFGRPGKKYGAALVNVKGRRMADFTKAELKDLKQYNGDDVDDTIFVFDNLLPHTPFDELRLIDMTVKMYAQPRLLLDKPMLLALEKSEIEHKQALLAKLGADKSELMSNDKFAVMLEAAGVTPPMKLSAKTGQLTYAMSKQDAEFKALLDHDDEIVRTLVEARFGVKSTSVETRAARFAARADFGPASVYLNYAGAKTLRWSGGDKANYQNMKRGSNLRKAIYAPPGHQLMIADLAQIEARMNAWFNHQDDIVNAFATGVDVYKLTASKIYNKPIDQITPEERFLGKCCVLALGYGAGWARFAQMLRLGALGPPIDITDQLARDIVSAWRSANAFIAAGWRRAGNNAKSAFLGQQSIQDGPITFIGKGETGLITAPNGTYIRYDKIKADEDGITYANRFRRLKDGSISEQRQRLYSGLYVENICQFLSRNVVAEHALEIADEVKNAQLVLTSHDELVFCVPNRSAAKALRVAKAVMTTPPSWAPDLPLGVDAHVSPIYDK
jgi:DNA polymerase bacteriophage-type